MWTSGNRPKYNRDKRRYSSDPTDDEWPHIEPRIPPAKHGGRKRPVEPNGVMYVPGTGCQWRYVPKDLPPKNCLVISAFGTGMARWIAFITRSK